MRVYGMSVSGNCHKVRQLLEQLGRAYEWIEVDSARGGARTPAFLARNPDPAVRACLGRVQATPGFVPMPGPDAEAAARLALHDRPVDPP